LKKNKKVFEHKVEFDIEFAVGDKIYFMANNEPIQDVVNCVYAEIEVSRAEIDTNITYKTDMGFNVDSGTAFKTKEDLIDWLLN